MQSVLEAVSYTHLDVYKRQAPMIETHGAISLPEKNYTIHPYVLGVWLGDGNSREGMICSEDQEVIDRAVMLEGGKSTFSHQVNNCVHVRLGPNVRREIAAKPRHTLQGRLRKLDLLQNKHIPQEYLRGSIDQRIDLLQGLIAVSYTHLDVYKRQDMERTALHEVLHLLLSDFCWAAANTQDDFSDSVLAYEHDIINRLLKVIPAE